MHLLATEAGAIADGMEAVDLAQTPADIVVLASADTEIALLAAAQSLKANPKNVESVAEMREALSSYPRYFNDPGWDKPVAADTQD